MTIIISKQENTNKKVNSAINVMKTYSISAERQKKFYKKHKRRGKMYKDIIINYGTELEKYSGADLVENDVDAYRIVYRTPWDLTGCTIKALCKRADGTVVSGTGFAEGKNAVFVIDSSMYAVPGELTVRLTVCTADEQVLTVCDVIANAVESFGDGIPGTNNKTILDQILINVSKINTALEGHKADESNPHAVTKEQVGLGNVDDVKQASKAEFDAHASAEVLSHPDGSVTTSKIAEGAINENKLDAELKTKINGKADKGTILADYGIGDAYTKAEVDAVLETKADGDDVYSAVQMDIELAKKADADNVYTKAETDAALENKADFDAVYTKEAAGNAFANALNLIPYPYDGEITSNGITYTNNNDGSISASGTATLNSAFVF